MKPLLYLCIATASSALGASGDPALAFVSFLPDSQGQRIARDGSGNLYIGGNVTSNAIPATQGAFQTSYRGGTCQRGLSPGGPCSDVFIAKWNPSGTRLLWATYLGGTGDDFLNAMAVDPAGNVYLAGATSSPDFPVTPGALQTHYNLSQGASGYLVLGDAFIAKLSPSGSTLLFATYLGGSSSDSAGAIAVDSAGNIYVSGATYSTDFPVSTGALQSVNHAYSPNSPGANAFVAKLNPAGNALIFSTYLGGSISDDAAAIAVDAAGFVYVAGNTLSPDFPTTPGAYQSSPGDKPGPYHGDAFLARLNASGSALLSSTYLGGSGTESLSAMVLDASGRIYLAGTTDSPDFPVTPDAIKTGIGTGVCTTTGQGVPIFCTDAFVVRFDPSATKLEYATYLGGTGQERGQTIAVDSQGYVYVAGRTFSADFPVTPDAFQPCSRSAGIAGNAFVTRFKPGNPLTYSTLLGGVGGALVSAMFVDDTGHLYLTGTAYEANVVSATNTYTSVADFPPAPVPVLQLGAGQGGGTFVGMIDLSASAPTNRISCIVSAADKRDGYISGGEIVEIVGKGLGPVQEVHAQVTPFGIAGTSLGGVQVFFSGRAAPLISVQAERIVAIAPGNIPLQSQTEVQVVNSGQATAIFSAAVLRATPAVFSQDGSGHGAAAVLNEDGTVNLPTNPAAKGSVIAIFCTGLGTGGSDGTINSGTPQVLAGKVGVSIDGYSADILFAGGAPGQVYGVFQVNVRVPLQASTGTADPLSLYIDESNLYGASVGLPGPTISVR